MHALKFEFLGVGGKKTESFFGRTLASCALSMRFMIICATSGFREYSNRSSKTDAVRKSPEMIGVLNID